MDPFIHFRLYCTTIIIRKRRLGCEIENLIFYQDNASAHRVNDISDISHAKVRLKEEKHFAAPSAVGITHEVCDVIF